MAIHRTTTSLEPESLNHHALISFRAIVAGLLIAMFSMLGLVGLGLALGGINMNADTSAQSVGIFSGSWFIGSTFISLFAGSYFAARVSKFRTGRIGSAQGIVIAALFLGFFLYQAGSAIGSLGSAAGTLINKSGSAIATGAQNETVTNTVSQFAEDAMGGLNLQSPPQEVAKGVAGRIIRGDTEGAKNYLAIQAGISPAEADARIAQMKGKADQYVADAKEATGTALKNAGWSLFFLVALGALASTLGGALGSVANFRRPLIRSTENYAYREQHA